MASKTLKEKKQIKAEVELKHLTLAYKRMGQQVKKKTGELMKSNQLLQEEILERKRIEAEILEITQEEQRRLGVQLHDGLCQELATILVFTKSLAKKMEKNNHLELIELKKISDMLLKAIDQARNTARGLYPGDLEDTSLMIALNELASHTSEGNCVFYCPKPVPIDDSNTATHLYRIAQEAVSNAVNHGKAKNIQIGLIQNKEEIILSIKDNGIGLSNAVQKSKGIGFKIMKYRAHMMNAIFQIAENKPHGVQLKCTLKKPKTNR